LTIAERENNGVGIVAPLRYLSISLKIHILIHQSS